MLAFSLKKEDARQSKPPGTYYEKVCLSVIAYWDIVICYKHIIWARNENYVFTKLSFFK